MRIATWERESKLSLGQLARQAGVARSLLNQVRAGETGIASGSIEGFARTFGFESGLAMRIEAARWWETAEAAEYRTRVAQRLGALSSPFAGHTELEAATHAHGARKPESSQRAAAIGGATATRFKRPALRPPPS
jgi:transcriptional regulator with XRE-family HTH domain